MWEENTASSRLHEICFQKIPNLSGFFVFIAKMRYTDGSFMKNSTKLTLKIYWQHAKRYPISGLAFWLAIVFGTIVNLSIPLYYKRFFDVLDGVVAPNIRTILLSILASIFLLKVLQWTVWRSVTLLFNYFQPRVMSDLANTCFSYLLKHSYGFFSSNFVGSLVKRVNYFTSSFENIFDNLSWYLLKFAVNIIFILVVLTSKNQLLGVIIVVWMALFLGINWLLTNYKLKYDLERSAAETTASGLLADTVTNHSNIKLFGGYAREQRTFAGAIERVRRLRKFTWDLDTAFDSIQAALAVFLEIGILYVAIRLWGNGSFTLGDFVLIQTYLITIFEEVWDFGKTIRHIYEALSNAEEMTNILDTPHEIKDRPDAEELMVTEGKIEFKKVDFNYNETRQILSNFSLTIAPHEKVAFVGTSGAGKSTIVKLLLRMHDVTGGKILIDGQKIMKSTQESLWQAISYVPQDTMLFHRSLLDNIRYGKPDATIEEVIEAAKKAHCHEFILDFPEQYETFVGERGVKLSGGERQRVALARAILRNTPILILDEATSSLDSESEHFIQDALANLMEGKTVIVIAHRLSTIMKMDRIVVIEAGQVIEDGTHQQLIRKRNGIYKKLWKLQSGGFIE